MPLALFNLTLLELAIVLGVGVVLLILPLGLCALLALRVFNEFQTQRRSDIVDQALTRDEDVKPLPAADEPSATVR